MNAKRLTVVVKTQYFEIAAFCDQLSEQQRQLDDLQERVSSSSSGAEGGTDGAMLGKIVNAIENQRALIQSIIDVMKAIGAELAAENERTQQKFKLVADVFDVVQDQLDALAQRITALEPARTEEK